MGRYNTREVLRKLCSQYGIALYRHWLDGASIQLCAGGYVVNGYVTKENISDIWYEMQKCLIHLLKYGDKGISESIVNNKGEKVVVWHKDKKVISPLGTPIRITDRVFGYTLNSLEEDREEQSVLDWRRRLI